MPQNKKTAEDESKEKLLEQIDNLKSDKLRLEKELKSREEMMNNLLAYIQSTEKGEKA